MRNFLVQQGIARRDLSGDREVDPLAMVAERGFPVSVLSHCQQLARDRCLCGRQIAWRTNVFCRANELDGQKTQSDWNQQPHYCIPCLSDDELLGVLILFVSSELQPQSDHGPFLAAVGNIITGMIERGRAEESLRDSEERFELAVRGSDAAIWDWNLLTNKVYFSSRWKTMLGYTEDEIGDDLTEWESRVHPDDRALALKTLGDYMEGRIPEYELEHRLQQKGGRYRWILARGAIVRDVTGKPYRMVGSHLDITARKESEQALRERDSQLIAAQRIQEFLLPGRSPKIPGFEIAGALVAAQFAGGDYYDYLKMKDDSLLIVVGDVVGHDVAAAIIMATASAHLRSFVEHYVAMEEIVKHTNSVMYKETDDDRFVTAFLLQLHPLTRTFRFINAGHPPGFVLGPAGEIKRKLCSNALPLAVQPHSSFPVTEIGALDSGDLVVLTTDGVLEARNADGLVFGTDRMLASIREDLSRPVEEIIANLQQAIHNFSGDSAVEDDITCVVLRVSPDANRWD